MRTIMLLAAVITTPLLSAHAQATSIHPDPVDALAGDTAALGRLIPAALAAGSQNGWEARDASIASGRSFAASGGKLVELRFDSTSIALRGVVAVLVAKYHLVLLTGSDRSTRDGTATEVFVRRGDAWVNPFWYLE
ncbi:MAG TPA: hypothetical protein VN607_02315 [Gemmatimonadaceae bacterium]|nr:hypothetical protein [Gemmatimonadaceae bacterium]